MPKVKKIAITSLTIALAILLLSQNIFAIESKKVEYKVDKIFVDAKPTDKNTSVIAINNYGPLAPEIVNLEIPTKIYDVSMVAYTKEYADRFGYPYSHAEELSDGLEVIQFRVHTEGSSNICTLDMILDKSIDANLPEKDFFNQRYLKLIHFPKKRGEYIDKKAGWMGYKISEEDRGYFKHRNYEYDEIRQNLSLATPDYNFNKVGMRISGFILVDHYVKDYLEDRIYLSLFIGCSATFHKLLSQPKVELWLPKKGVSEITSEKKNFTPIEIPERIRSFAEKLMNELEYRHRGQIKKELIKTTNNEGDK